MRLPKPKPISERALSAQIRRLFALAGCVVYSSEQGYRKEPGGTRSTPGQADLLVFLPFTKNDRDEGRSMLGFFEVKTPAGLKEHIRLALLDAPPTAGQAKAHRKVHGQNRFAVLCIQRGIPYGMGGIDEAWGFLVSVGLARQLLSASENTKFELIRGPR